MQDALLYGAHRPRGNLIRVAAAAMGGGVLLLLLALIAYPSAMLVAQSFLADGRWTLANYLRVLRDADVYRVLGNSVEIGVWSTLGGVALGAAVAWLVARTDLPGRRFWRTALILPYLIPPFIGAMAWVYLLSPVGYLNQIYMAATGAADPLFVIYGRWGIVAVLILYQYPIAYMILLGALERMNPALEEAARISGASPGWTLVEITLPVMAPALGSAALLLLMSSLANFGIPAVLGFPARYFVLTTKIYATVQNFDMRGNLQVAAAMSMWLVGLAVAMLWAQRRALGQRGFAVVIGQAAPQEVTSLGRWGRPVAAGLGLFVAAAVLLPLGAILLTSLIRAYGLPPVPENLTLRHYHTVLFGVPKVARAIRNSLLFAGVSATAVVILATAIAYLVLRVRIRAAQVLETIVLIPYAVPGTVVALAMILAWIRPVPVLGIRLYDTAWIILVAYVARFLVFGVRTIGAAVEQVHESLEEAARIAGAPPAAAFREIVLPIIRPSVAAAWFLAFIPAVAELTVSVLLFSVGNETLGVVVFGLHEEGKAALAAAIAFVVTVMILGLNLVTRAATGGEMGF